MENKPVLVVMAAGMGSRYGGLKQVEPVTPAGDLIIDFSLYDAVQAGFETVIFIIRRDMEALFRERIGDRMESILNVRYAFQELDDLPEGFTVPDGRVKPFGTGHAILACRRMIDSPFAVINADDYYGPAAFQLIFGFLSDPADHQASHFAMIGYQLINTVSDNGHVARGICQVNADDTLSGLQERTRIEKQAGGIAFSEDDGHTWQPLSGDTLVSMNFWGFQVSMMKELEDRFPLFLQESLQVQPLKSEFLLPVVVDRLLHEQCAHVHVLRSPDRWFGVTYQADKPVVTAALSAMKENGEYPDPLFAKQ